MTLAGILVLGVYLSNSAPIRQVQVESLNHLQAPANQTSSNANDGRVYRVKEPGIQPPRLIHSVDPYFSDYARAHHVSGTVLVGLVVDETGTPLCVHVIRGVGAGLDEEAVKAVSQYRFKPATKDRVPVKVELSVIVNYQQ